MPESVLAFEKVYEEFHTPLKNFLFYKTGNPDTANDFLQETFIKYWNK